MVKRKPNSWRSVLLWSLFGLAAVAIVYSFRAPNAAGPINPVDQRKGTLSFSAPDLNGTPWHLSDQRGKVVLLNIFATWCPPCRQETPGLVKLSRQFAGKQVAFVGVSVDEGGSAVVEKFVKQYDIPYPVLFPPAGDPLTANVQAIPVTLLIDSQGRIAKHYVGAVDESTFAHDIEQVLKEKNQT
jgi:peroxiredoxin